MSLPEAAVRPVLLISSEGDESPDSAPCFRAVRDLAGRIEAARQGLLSPLALRVRYAIDTPFALATNGVWRVSSDWDATTITFQAVLRSDRVVDVEAEVGQLLQGALWNARRHAQRTGLADSLDGLDRLVEDVTAGAAAGAVRPASPPAARPAVRPGSSQRRGWMSTTLPTTPDRVLGWQREFQARRHPKRLETVAALLEAMQAVVPYGSPVTGVTLGGYAVLSFTGASGAFASMRVPVRLLEGLRDELATVTEGLRFARDVDADGQPSAAAPSARESQEARLPGSARMAGADDGPGPKASLVRFGAELGVHEGGSADGQRVGVLVLLDDSGRVTRLAATRAQLGSVYSSVHSCLTLLGLPPEVRGS